MDENNKAPKDEWPQEFKNQLIRELRDSTAGAVLESSKATIAFAQAAIRGAFILNGSATLAVFTKIGIHHQMVPLIEKGAVGALSAVICGGLSYLSQKFYTAAGDAEVSAAIRQISKSEIPKHSKSWQRWIADAFALTACCFFGYSLYMFYSALVGILPFLALPSPL